MVDNRKAVKRRLDGLLMNLHGHRRDLEAYRKRGDAAEVERCERLLKASYSRIREFCAEHNMELPPDVPEENIGGEDRDA